MKPVDIKNLSERSLQDSMAEVMSPHVIDVADHEDALVEEMSCDRVATGIKLPWGKTHSLVRLREGEYSVFCGPSGHFKSTLSFQICLWAMVEVKIGILSMEMRRSDVQMIFSQQAAGNINPSEEFRRRLMRWQRGRMLFFDYFGMIDPIRALGVMRYMLGKGCKLVVVDSMMLCKVTDDLDAEKAFVAEIARLSEEFKAHIMVVHHTRKLSNERGGDLGTPTRSDVRGSGAITDLASSLFIVWNDKQKAALLRKRDEYDFPLTDRETEYVNSRPCQKLIVCKQRHSPFEGAISLFKHPSRQFLSTNRKEAIPFEF